MVELDVTVLVFVFGSVVTSIVGFVVIWNSLRIAKRESKDDLEKQNKELEGRIKDHINYKVEILDTKVDNVKDKVEDINEDIKKKEEIYHKKFEGLSDWLRNVEGKVSGRYYKSGIKPENNNQ